MFSFPFLHYDYATVPLAVEVMEDVSRLTIGTLIYIMFVCFLKNYLFLSFRCFGCVLRMGYRERIDEIDHAREQGFFFVT